MLAMRVLTCLGIVGLTTPALSVQFFIVQEPGTNRCTIVEQAGSGSVVVVFGDGAYGDRPSPGSGASLSSGIGPTETDPPRRATCEGLLPAQETSNSNKSAGDEG